MDEGTVDGWRFIIMQLHGSQLPTDQLMLCWDELNQVDQLRLVVAMKVVCVWSWSKSQKTNSYMKREGGY